MSTIQAATLIDQLIYEQVLECIDVEALYRLEQSLAMIVGEIDGVPADRTGELAGALIDRALARLPDDLRRYLLAPVGRPARGPVDDAGPDGGSTTAA